METNTVVEMIVTGQKDLAWFESQKNELIEKFDNKFIAFQNKQVLESDVDVDKLVLKLQSKGLDTSQVLIRFVSKTKTLL